MNRYDIALGRPEPPLPPAPPLPSEPSLNHFNHREADRNLRQNCYYCIHFLSYADMYEDELEPEDLGECKHKEMMEKDGSRSLTGIHNICDLFSAYA